MKVFIKNYGIGIFFLYLFVFKCALEILQTWVHVFIL